MEDIRQRTLYGASYGSAQKDPANQRPVSRTIISAFLAAGDISRGHKNISGVLLGENQGSETILPNQEDVTRVRKSVEQKMTRHYLGKFTDDFHFLEKLVSSTNQMAEHCAERNYGFWAAKDPTAAVYSPVNPLGSCSMINEARDMLALIKGIRENLRTKEPYHDQLAKARSYAAREKRRREKEKSRKRSYEGSKKDSKKMTWSKLEMARQTAWKYLTAIREALRKDEIPKCVSYGERAREIAETLPYQAFSLGRKESTFIGKSSYKENREILVCLGLAQLPANSVVLDETVTDTKFPFRDPHRLILKCEKWLGMTPKEPRTSLSYKPNPETRHIESPKSTPKSTPTSVPIKACGGELEKAWLYHEIARCRLRIGHMDLAKQYSRLALTASKRAIIEEHDTAGFDEDEWGSTSKENQKWTAAWLVNALILTARVESINGTMDDSEAALVTALEEVKKRFPECEKAQEWIRLAIRTVKWVRDELNALKTRVRRGSILSSNTIKQSIAPPSDSVGLSTAALQKYGLSSSRRDPLL
ncbi:hypothetical protein J437_LFUL009611 [Ladona fulva]|uniref:Uncharacterized protein n=1 Tax=Ladona fulva TaxID=123851 RepID=A0A8K0K6D5_LADFU|nr:hypothetical protein J437_LFUL009611 [Ladona fulva]